MEYEFSRQAYQKRKRARIYERITTTVILGVAVTGWIWDLPFLGVLPFILLPIKFMINGRLW